MGSEYTSFDFSARLSSEGGMEDDSTEEGSEMVSRALQTSLISFASKSRDNGIIPSRSSDHRTSTRSSRCEYMRVKDDTLTSE